MQTIEEFGDADLRTTRDHFEIRSWAAHHDGVPAEIMGMSFDGAPNILHFLFGNERSGSVEIQPISWDDFFAQFDVLGLSVMVDDNSSQFEIVQVEKKVDLSTFN